MDISDSGFECMKCSMDLGIFAPDACTDAVWPPKIPPLCFNLLQIENVKEKCMTPNNTALYIKTFANRALLVEYPIRHHNSNHAIFRRLAGINGSTGALFLIIGFRSLLSGLIDLSLGTLYAEAGYAVLVL